MSTLLEVDGVHTLIGQYHILQGVSFGVQREGATVLLGRNGAGKTTTLRTIMGLLAPSAGRILWEGAAIGGRPPYAVARLGVGYVPEDRGIFQDLTVEENLLLGLRRGAKMERKKEEIFSLFPDLARLFRRKGGTLSGGQQQMLAIARAFVSDARLILLDEPSKGLAPLLVQEVAHALNVMKATTTILLVEQNFAMASQVGDRYCILDNGQSVQSGTMADLIQDAELQSRYLGLGTGAPKGVA